MTRCNASDAQSQSKTIFCGVNSAAEQLEKGENQNCRALAVINNTYVGFFRGHLPLMQCALDLCYKQRKGLYQPTIQRTIKYGFITVQRASANSP